MESLGVQAMTISDGTTVFDQQEASAVSEEIKEQVIELESGSTAFFQQVTLQKESITFEVGQPVALEDGTMAFIHHTSKEGYDPNNLEAIELEDGSTAFIHHPISILAVQADTGLQELVVGKKGDAFDLGNVTSLKDCTSKDFQEEEVKGNGKELNIPDKTYHCAYSGCSRLFATSHHLKVHERVHTGDRPYQCDFRSCGKTFTTGYSLKSHVRIHTGEKPYKCQEDLCTKAFKTSGDLQKHIRTHTGERPFQCPFEGCGRSFTTSNICKVHIRTHTGERPYMCPEPNCGRGFTSATNYKNHMRIHTGEKPYACLVPGCGKRFTEYSSLYKHHVVHTHCKPYTCNTCGKTYRQTSTLAMHKRTVHGELEVTIENEQVLFEQKVEDTIVDNIVPQAKHQCIVSVKMEDEEQEECAPSSEALPSQDDVLSQVTTGTPASEDSSIASIHDQELAVVDTANGTHIAIQLELQQNEGDAIGVATTAVQQESTVLKQLHRKTDVETLP